jgi:hypothetical protein
LLWPFLNTRASYPHTAQALTRKTALPFAAGTDSTEILLGPWKTAAFIFFDEELCESKEQRKSFG